MRDLDVNKRARYVAAISFLIDQQCSSRLVVRVKDDDKTYQPIALEEQTRALGIARELIQLSRAQALELSKVLVEAAELCFEPNSRVEYPGMVIDVLREV